GTESMSNFPLLMGPALVRFFQRLGKARSLAQRLGALSSFRLGSLQPRVAIIEGLTDPTTGLLMGETAELVARRFGIDRTLMDQFALTSHERAAKAQAEHGFASELTAYVAHDGRGAVLADDGIRSNQTLE